MKKLGAPRYQSGSSGFLLRSLRWNSFSSSEH
jgi:hypothetical protein